MAKKRKKKRATTKRRRRRNPSARSITRRVGSRARATIGGMNIGGALRNTVPHVCGMMAAQWGAKKFSDGGGANDPNWEFKNYLIGGASAFGAGMIAENIKRGSGQKVLEGGLALLAYKVLVNEVAPQNEWFMEQFGQDEFEIMGQEDEYEAIFGADYDPFIYGQADEYEAIFGGDNEYTEGDAYLADDGETYILGADGRWYPVSESHRIPDDLSGELERPGALGGELERPGTLGAQAVYPPEGRYRNDPFMHAYDGRG